MLSTSLQVKMQKFADIYRECFNIPLPVTFESLENAIKKIGGSVRKGDSQWDTKIIKTGENSFIIELSHFDCKYGEERKKFALAKAIGVLFFTCGYMLDEKTWGNYCNPAEKEVEE